MPISTRELIRRLQKLGWEVKSQKGSHVRLVKDGKATFIPFHGGKDIKIGTLKAIEKQTGEKLR